MSIVRAIQSCVLTVVDNDGNGAPVSIRVNDPFDTDDPVVQQHRYAFTGDVEQATAAPGEKRNARR